MLVEKVLNTIKENNLIEKGERILVGISGGPDSVCLLHVLHTLSGELGIQLAAIHVNHMLRGEESEQDEKYVEQLCSHLGIALYKTSSDIKKYAEECRVSIEEAGREERYRIFSLHSDRMGKAKIAVAHNKNDQAETILMHLLRGSGLEGLLGMEYKRGLIIRPLLDVVRMEIEGYCSENALNPRLDSSNMQSVYTRNKIRLKLIPYMEELFGRDGITDSLNKMAMLLKVDNNFIEENSKRLYNQFVANTKKGSVVLDLKEYAHIHEALQRRLLRMAIQEIKGDLRGIGSPHIALTEDLAAHGKSGSLLHLPSGIRVIKGYGCLEFFREIETDLSFSYQQPLKIPGVTVVEERSFSIDAVLEIRVNQEDLNMRYSDSGFEQYFDYERLNGGIYIRNRQEGDVFKPLKSSGTKKLKEYLIDKKIPKSDRSSIPLIAAGNEIVWLIGYKISDKFKVTENTKNVLKLRYVQKNQFEIL